jgi:hypothetical protein
MALYNVSQKATGSLGEAVLLFSPSAFEQALRALLESKSLSEAEALPI